MKKKQRDRLITRYTKMEIEKVAKERQRLQRTRRQHKKVAAQAAADAAQAAQAVITTPPTVTQKKTVDPALRSILRHNIEASRQHAAAVAAEQSQDENIKKAKAGSRKRPNSSTQKRRAAA